MPGMTETLDAHADSFAKNAEDATRNATALNANYTKLLRRLHDSGVTIGGVDYMDRQVPVAIVHEFTGHGARMDISIPPVERPKSEEKTEKLSVRAALHFLAGIGRFPEAYLTAVHDLDARTGSLHLSFRPSAVSPLHHNQLTDFAFDRPEQLEAFVLKYVEDRIGPEQMVALARPSAAPATNHPQPAGA